MLQRIIAFATRRPKRVIALWIVAVLGLASIGGTQSYRVTTDDMTEFLPESSESAVATRYAQEEFGQKKGTSTVTAVVERADGARLTASDRAAIGVLSERLAGWKPDVAKLHVEGAVGGLEKRLQHAIGFDQKVAQYDVGERFVAHVVDRAGMSGFNLIWQRPANLPRPDEIGDPDRWIARVTG